jgi:hypothetical protein
MSDILDKVNKFLNENEFEGQSFEGNDLPIGKGVPLTLGTLPNNIKNSITSFINKIHASFVKAEYGDSSKKEIYIQLKVPTMDSSNLKHSYVLDGRYFDFFKANKIINVEFGLNNNMMGIIFRV